VGLFSKKPQEVRDCLLPGGDVVDVVGESHYQDALEAITGGRTEEGVDCERWAYLLPEPDNPYDRNAVAVSIDGQTVGYLSRSDAAAYLPFLTQLWSRYGLRSVCRASIRGGWQRGEGDFGFFGVKLALAQPEYLEGPHEWPLFDPADPPPLKGTQEPKAQPSSCRACGAALAEGAKFCGECGVMNAYTPQPYAACGVDLVEGAKFCGECGAAT
jgi:hypothetical protein